MHLVMCLHLPEKIGSWSKKGVEDGSTGHLLGDVPGWWCKSRSTCAWGCRRGCLCKLTDSLTKVVEKDGKQVNRCNLVDSLMNCRKDLFCVAFERVNLIHLWQLRTTKERSTRQLAEDISKRSMRRRRCAAVQEVQSSCVRLQHLVEEEALTL